MSRTYEIMCHTCKETLWVGQGWPVSKGEVDHRVIYTGEPHTMKLLRDFLFRHESTYQEKHELAFWDDEHTFPDSDGYHQIHWAESDDPEDKGNCDCERPACVAARIARSNFRPRMD